MKRWNNLPETYQKDIIKPYYLFLEKKRFYWFIKRMFDIFASLLLLILLTLPGIIISFVVLFSSGLPIFFRQERVGIYGKSFTLYKFRTMYKKDGDTQQVTSKEDKRITSCGLFLRKTHIDELPQLVNVLLGHMSFVGPRPELNFFVSKYKDEWLATLLVKPGITSKASCLFENEALKLSNCDDANQQYVDLILPRKMEINLEEIYKLSFHNDILIMINTLFKKNKV